MARRESLPLYQAALREAAEAHGVTRLALQPLFQLFLPQELFALPPDDHRLRSLGHRLLGESVYIGVRDGGILGEGS